MRPGHLPRPGQRILAMGGPAPPPDLLRFAGGAAMLVGRSISPMHAWPLHTGGARIGRCDRHPLASGARVRCMRRACRAVPVSSTGRGGITRCERSATSCRRTGAAARTRRGAPAVRFAATAATNGARSSRCITMPRGPRCSDSGCRPAAAARGRLGRRLLVRRWPAPARSSGPARGGDRARGDVSPIDRRVDGIRALLVNRHAPGPGRRFTDGWPS